LWKLISKFHRVIIVAHLYMITGVKCEQSKRLIFVLDHVKSDRFRSLEWRLI